MFCRSFVVATTLLLACSAWANRQVTQNQSQTQFLSTSLSVGKELYDEHCAACHGTDGKGHGPAANSLKRQPSDLTRLTIRHGGNFPYDYVSKVLTFGPGSGPGAHGSAVMPAWGFIFRHLENQDEALVQQRIRNLDGYLLYLQVAAKSSN